MFAPPVIQLLSGERLHLAHGPIDIVLRAWGTPEATRAAGAAAWARFGEILPELCDELPLLRTPMEDLVRRCSDGAAPFDGAVARRMYAACLPFADVFVTPMAAVAGAVADELMAAMVAAAPITRAYVNDGGDIAVRVPQGESLAIGVAGDFAIPDAPAVNGRLHLTPALGVGGIATSGARGRSFSLGIADSVTILAADAASADVAATLVANAVTIESPAVTRRPARDLDPDSDLGERPVTVSVGPLAPRDIEAALSAGAACAAAYRARGLIRDAALMLAGHTRVVGMSGLESSRGDHPHNAIAQQASPAAALAR